MGEAWTGPNRWRDGRESGVLVQAIGSPWTGQSRELVKPYPLTLSGNVIERNHANAEMIIIFSDRVVLYGYYNFNPNQRLVKPYQLTLSGNVI